MTAPTPPDPRAEVLRLARTHPPRAIAEATGLSLSNVYRILWKANVTAARQPYTGTHDREQKRANCLAQWTPEGREARGLRKVMRADGQPAEPKPPPTRVNPMRFAELMYGTRLVNRGGAWHLDGMPIRYSDLMRRVNADHKAQGMPQPLTACEDWLC